MLFKFTPVNGQIKWDDPIAVNYYCIKHNNKKQIADVCPEVIRSEKTRMMNYYHGVILVIVMEELTILGYESVDKVFADWWMKNECAKNIKYNIIQYKEQIFLESKSVMTKDRLTKFLNDCCLYIEANWHRQVPDSSEYKFWYTEKLKPKL